MSGTSDTSGIEQKLSAARYAVFHQAPYYAAMLYAMRMRPSDKVQTMAVTPRLVCYYNPAEVATWTLRQISSVMVHELHHVLRAHNLRREAKQADPGLWNIAADCEINDDDCLPKWELPAGAVYPKSFKLVNGLTAEEYYQSLRSQAEEANAKGGGGGPKCPHKCGAAAGNPSDAEAGQQEADAEEEQAPTPAEVAAIRRDVAEAVQVAAEKGHGTGHVPASLLRWAEGELTPPKVRWQDKLARACRRSVAYVSGRVDYHYQRPSRRQAALGFGAGHPILPAMRQPVPHVLVALDTSGSMGGEELRLAISETKGILEATPSQISFMSCDCSIHVEGRASTVGQLRDMVRGGGGTSFIPVFDRAARLPTRPDILVFITDGCGPAPDAPPPGTEVIWLLVGAHRRAPVPWGTVVELD